MPKAISEDDLTAIEEALSRRPVPMSTQQLYGELGERIPLRTFQYRLKYLVDHGRIVKRGEGRWARYALAAPGADTGPGDRSTLPQTARAILQAAATCFLDHGYDVSLDRIAVVAGVTKPTIYSYFKDKEELFRAAMAEVAEEMTPRIAPPSNTGDLREELLRYARTFRNMALSERNLLAYRAALISLQEEPGTGLLALRRSLLRINQGLTDFFGDMVARGTIRSTDPELLSEYFFAAAAGQSRTRRLMGLDTEAAEREDRYLALFVDSFLAGILPDLTPSRLNR